MREISIFWICTRCSFLLFRNTSSQMITLSGKTICRNFPLTLVTGLFRKLFSLIFLVGFHCIVYYGGREKGRLLSSWYPTSRETMSTLQGEYRKCGRAARIQRTFFHSATLFLLTSDNKSNFLFTFIASQHVLERF